MTKVEPGFSVMPSQVELTGRQLWFGSHELRALFQRLRTNLDMMASANGPAWGTDQVGQTYGPDYLTALRMIEVALESYARDLGDNGKTIVTGANEKAVLDDEFAKKFAAQMVEKLPRTVEPRW